MSSALVRKSLALVEEDFGAKGKHRSDNVLNQFMPENQKLKRQLVSRGRKGQKVNLLQTYKKLTVAEAKKTQKSKEAILKANLERLKLIREACRIDLEEDITQKLIERAVTKKPIKKRSKPKVEQKTAFTEEDFKKFEEEYFDED